MHEELIKYSGNGSADRSSVYYKIEKNLNQNNLKVFERANIKAFHKEKFEQYQLMQHVREHILDLQR